MFHRLAQHVQEVGAHGAIDNERVFPFWDLHSVDLQFLKLHQARPVCHHLVGLIIDGAENRHALLAYEIACCEVGEYSPLDFIHARVSHTGLLVHLLVDARVKNDRGIVYLIDEVLLEF